MSSAGKNRTQEHITSIRIAAADLKKNLYDGRNSLRHGTTEQLCSQYGISVRRDGKQAVLSARRDQLQLVVEIIHYSSVKYSVVP